MQHLQAGLQCVIFFFFYSTSVYGTAFSLYKCGLIYFAGFICPGVYAFGQQLVCFICALLMLDFTECVCVHSNNWTCCSVFYENLQDTNAAAGNKHISFLSKRQASCSAEP